MTSMRSQRSLIAIYIFSMHVLTARAQVTNAGPSLNSVKKTLNVDVESILRSRCDWAKVTSIEVKLLQENFTRIDTSKTDYLLEARLDANNWHERVTYVLAFVKHDSSYRETFFWDGWGKGYLSHPKLVDIDSDNRSEILIEADFSGNNASTNEVDIWKFNGTIFENIFHEDLELSSPLPYSYKNQYKFVRNSRDTLMWDIAFVVDAGILQGTGAEGLTRKEYKNIYGVFPPKRIRQRVMYVFDGNRYTPTEPVPDYRAFLNVLENARAK